MNPGMCKLLETKLLNYFDGFRKHRVKFLDNTFIDYYTLTDFLLDLSNGGGCEIYELKENYS